MEETPALAFHKCCKKEHPGQCELTTVTASQISAFLGFLVYISFEVIHLLFFDKAPKDAEGTIDYFVKFFITATFVITILYYFFGCWATEEDLIDDLRSLKPKGLFFWQWWIRITILMLLAFFSIVTSTLIEHFSKNRMNDPADSENFALLTYLGTLFFVFILWDIVICFGHQWKLIKRYFWIDLSGLIIILFGFGYHSWELWFLCIIMIAWIILVVLIVIKMNTTRSFHVLFRINKIKYIR
jgi:hypothetical protein